MRNSILILVIILLTASQPLNVLAKSLNRTSDTDAILEHIAEIKAESPTFKDDFRLNDGAWESMTAKGLTTFAPSYRSGAFHAILNKAKKAGAWQRTDFTASNFYLELDVLTKMGKAGYGIIFNYGDIDNTYLFGIDTEGSYSLQKIVGGNSKTLSEAEAPDRINSGEGATNHLGILVEDGQICLLANGTVLTTIQDEPSTAGSIGLFAGLHDGQNADIAFDKLNVWTLDDLSNEASYATPTVDSTETQLATIPEIKADRPTFHYDFERNNQQWGLGEDGKMSIARVPHALQIAVASENYFGRTSNAKIDTLAPADFLAEFDVSQATSVKGYWGLLFRVVDRDNFYQFVISDRATYSLWRNVDGAWTAIVPWTKSSTIKTGVGATNRLGVLTQGAQITLLINNQIVNQTEDDTFATGSLQLTAGTLDVTGLKVNFDNVNLWTLAVKEKSGEATPDATLKEQEKPAESEPTPVPSSADEVQALPVPSKWQGEIRGKVFDQSFRLPVTIIFDKPLPLENNPVNLFIGVANPAQVGSLSLYSAMQFTPSSGGAVTLQYFTVNVQGAQLRATLTDDHAAEAAMATQFTGPNVSAQTAPPVMKPIYKGLGPTELFALLQKAEVTINLAGDEVTGSVQGTGGSVTGIFPLPAVIYEAEFVATLVR